MIDVGKDPGEFALALHAAARQGALIGLLADRGARASYRAGGFSRRAGTFSDRAISAGLNA